MIKTFDFKFRNVPSNMVQCLSFNGEPWFRGIDVGSILEYARPRKAVMDHVPVKFKKPYKSLLDTIGRPEIGRQTQDYNELNAMFINEAGLYRLIMRSKTEKAEEFTDWVCSEVLPTIRKTGSYIPNQEGVKRFLLIDDTSKYAQDRVNNPTGENVLHYALVKHIRKIYPFVVITSGLGENQITQYIKLDSWNKGYEKGTPDLELKCKVGDYTDVVAIELKNPDESNTTSEEQDNYLKKLEKINVKTYVSNDYDDVVEWLRNHYQELHDKPKSSYNFATREDPDYWTRKLQSKENLITECKIRNIDLNEMWKLSNKKIAIHLIAYDKTHNA